MKKIIVFLAFAITALGAFSDSMVKENVIEKLEFSYSSDQNAVFAELMDFLKGKWNLDNDYAAQVLGFLSGYLPNHRDARKYYKSIRKEIKNVRLVKLLDDISDGDFRSTVSYLNERKLSYPGYLWFMCFGNFSETAVDILLDYYNSVDESVFVARMEIRYYYERHDLVENAVDKRNETLFKRVREKSYEELDEEFRHMIRDMKTSN